jgi:glycosyltransferase involved in cell wall biosynthesis
MSTSASPSPVQLPTGDADRPLRIALLIYRGNPHCGGQGVYTRYLAKEMVALGHTVEVFSGPPYPDIDEVIDGVRLTKVPSLDLYRPDNPFRLPWPWEITSLADAQEVAIMAGAGFPEPFAFSRRVQRMLRLRRAEFDVVHDNQCLGTGLLDMLNEGWPIIETLHHPITVDRDLELAHTTSKWRAFTLKRWYGFLGMQMRVARAMPRIVTVSENSKKDIVAQMGVREEQLHTVAVGVDQDIFQPMPALRRIPGRIICTTSSDVPMKGLTPMLEALAKVRTDHPDAHLVCIGKPKQNSVIPGVIARLGLSDAIEFVSGVTTERIVELYAEAELAVVPSLYEGFSLPAIEAMACGVPLIATTGGALPEVVGTSEETGILVAPNDPEALAAAIRRMLDDPELRDRIGEAGRVRVLDRFTWKACAAGTIEQYRLFLEEHGATRKDA